MGGKLVYLIGPSGAGKDSVLNGVAARGQGAVHVMKRYITRSAEAEGEDAYGLSPEHFDRMEQEGKFAMSWRANGLAYGIATEMNQHLAAGRTVLVNGSRAYCETAAQRYPGLLVVLLKVQTELLLQRLLARGRENREEIAQRLARNATMDLAFVERLREHGTDFLLLDNSGALDATIGALLDRITPATIRNAS